MPNNDDTRDIVIALREQVLALGRLLTDLRGQVDDMREERELEKQERAQERGGKAMLMWLGGLALAAAGGVGAISAKLAGVLVASGK